MKNKLIFLLFVLSLITTLVSQSRWKEIQLPYSTHKFTIIDFADSLTGWIFSEDGVYLRTSNGGTSWTMDSTTNVTKVGAVKCFGFSSGYIITQPLRFQGVPITIYRTFDGKLWEKIMVHDSIKNQITSVGFISEQKLMMPYYFGILLSTDKGSSWTVNKIFPKYKYQHTIIFSDSLKGFFERSGFSSAGEFIVDRYKTSNGGENWEIIDSNDCAIRLQIMFYNKSFGFEYIYCAPGDFGSWSQINVTNDGGISWKNPTFSLGDGYINPSDIITIIQYESGNGLFLSLKSSILKDNDSTFYVVTKDTLNLKVVAFESFNENYNWILATGNRLFQSIDIPTGIEKEKSSSPNQFNLNQNYPNPFNPDTRIRYEIPKRSFVSLELYDLLGRKIVTLVDQEEDAGEHTIALQSGTYKLTSGIYFYTLRADRYVQTRKMILLK